MRSDFIQKLGFYTGIAVALALLVAGLFSGRTDRSLLLLLGGFLFAVALTVSSPLFPRAMEQLTKGTPNRQADAKDAGTGDAGKT